MEHNKIQILVTVLLVAVDFHQGKQDKECLPGQMRYQSLHTRVKAISLSFHLKQHSSIKLLSCFHSFFRLFPLDIIAGSTLALDPTENCSVSTFYRHVCVPLTMAEAYQAERPAVFPGCLHMCIVGKPLVVN